jgi:hypothetical protein
MPILAYWLMQDEALLEQSLIGMQAKVDEDQSSNGGNLQIRSYLHMALITAAQGDAEETERLVRRWHRLAPADEADFGQLRRESCRILAMVKATDAVV